MRKFCASWRADHLGIRQESKLVDHMLLSIECLGLLCFSFKLVAQIIMKDCFIDCSLAIIVYEIGLAEIASSDERLRRMKRFSKPTRAQNLQASHFGFLRIPSGLASCSARSSVGPRRICASQLETALSSTVGLYDSIQGLP